MRFPEEHGGTEPLGSRIIELPQSDLSAESRDPRTRFRCPRCRPAASKKARRSSPPAGTARPSDAPSATAPSSRALGEVPPIVGRVALCTSIASINDIKISTRTGTWTPLMKAVVDKLEDADMIGNRPHIWCQGTVRGR